MLGFYLQEPFRRNIWTIPDFGFHCFLWFNVSTHLNDAFFMCKDFLLTFLLLRGLKIFLQEFDFEF